MEKEVAVVMKGRFPISSEVVGLDEVLKGKYRIPVYQRPYEWDEKNIDDFLTSIFDNFKDMINEKKNSRPIFFGTIQLNKESKIDEIEDIVDGQQRLTTFLLFLSCLQILDGIEEKNINSCEVIGADTLNKVLKLNQMDEDLSFESSRYFINKRLLFKKVRTYSNEFDQGTHFYCNVMNYVVENVYFVKLNTTEMELSDVVGVFNTINTTGLDLNASDIFKFRYYDYLRRLDDTQPWMENINDCYRLIERSNEKRDIKRTDQSLIDMSWVLDVYKHIICAKFKWGFSEVSKSNQKFFDELFKGKKYETQKDVDVLTFESFHNIVAEFLKFWRWIEDVRYNNEHQEIVKELFSGSMIEKTRYSRYWTIPFMVAYFKADNGNWADYYIDSLKVNLNMFKFFSIYTVINDRVINAIQSKVCGDCFDWFSNYSVDDIIKNIKNIMWAPIRWEGDNPKKEFQEVIKKGLFYNGSRVHLICTLIALLDEIENLGESIECSSGKFTVSECSIRERLFDWENKPYDVEHIIARNCFKNDIDNIDEFNGIGNLVVLDRNINRNIKDKPVIEKISSYKESIYASVRLNLLKNYSGCDNWGIEIVRKRQDEELNKIMMFMDD